MTEQEKKQSAGFYTILEHTLRKHQSEIEAQKRLQIEEIERIVGMFSLKFEEFQTVFDWKQKLGKTNVANCEIFDKFYGMIRDRKDLL